MPGLPPLGGFCKTIAFIVEAILGVVREAKHDCQTLLPRRAPLSAPIEPTRSYNSSSSSNMLLQFIFRFSSLLVPVNNLKFPIRLTNRDLGIADQDHRSLATLVLHKVERSFDIVHP